MRAIFATLVNLWSSTLTQIQRDAWEFWAAAVEINGEFVTGQNAYVRNNSPRLQAGLARVDAAPTILDSGTPVSSFEVTVDAIPNAIGIDLAETSLATKANVVGGASTDGDVLLYLGGAINPSRKFFNGPYQLAAIASIADAATEALFSTLFTSLLSANGDPIVGQNRGINARIAYDDGRLSSVTALLGPVVADSI